MDMKKILENMDAAAVGNKPFTGDTNFNDMKKILEGFDTVTKTEKETINEAAAVTMTADTPSQVGELMSMMRNAGMDPKVMPGNNVPMVPNARLDDPKIPGKDDVPGDVDLKANLLGKIAGGAAGGAAGSVGGAAIGSKYGAMAGNAIAPGVGGPVGAAIGSAVGAAAPAVAGAELVGGEDADIDMSPTDQQLADEADNELARMRKIAGLPQGDVEESNTYEDEKDFDRSSVTWEELKPHVMLVQKKILMDIEEAEKEIADFKAGGDDGEPGGDIYEIEPYLRDLKDMLEYPKHILQNPKMDIETIVDHMMPTGLDTSVREDLIGRFKTVIGHKDPQLAKRLFMDPELDFYAQGKARDGALDGIKDSIDPELERMRTVAGLPQSDVEEDYANEPDEDYAPYSDMVKGGDDIGKSKKSHKPVAGGDNPMALEDSIREQLWAALNEKMAVEGRGRGKKTLKASRGEKLNASRGSTLKASRGEKLNASRGSKLMAGRGRGKKK